MAILHPKKLIILVGLFEDLKMAGSCRCIGIFHEIYAVMLAGLFNIKSTTSPKHSEKPNSNIGYAERIVWMHNRQFQLMCVHMQDKSDLFGDSHAYKVEENCFSFPSLIF